MSRSTISRQLRGAALIATLAAMAFIAAPAQADEPADRNLARAAKYVMSVAPSYEHCTDPGDVTQLTDGRLTEGYFWTQKSTVGWQSAAYVTITMDLGKIQPIGGASFRTAAGVAGVLWPAGIHVHVSDDGKDYRQAGDLVELDETPGTMPAGYAVRQFSTTKLTTRGRYVRFVAMPTGPYLFCDEVEILRGDDALLQTRPAGTPVGDLKTWCSRVRVKPGIRRRFDRDVHGLKQAIQTAKLDEAAKAPLLGRLNGLAQDLLASAKPLDHESFRAVLPFNPIHANLFAVQASLWRALGHGGLSAWVVQPYDPTDPFQPPVATPGRIEVHTMGGEYRSAAFNLANTTDAPVKVSVRFKDLPNSPAPPWITVHEVPWTDTVSGQPVTAALPHAARTDQGWTIEVVPGLVRQVWLTFHALDLLPGEHAGHVIIEADSIKPLSLPVRLKVYSMTLPPRTTLWVGGWDYTDQESMYGMTPTNHQALVEHLRSRFVNAPWATSASIMQVTFTNDSPPKAQLDTRRFDAWLNQWPDAQAYFVFASVGDNFLGVPMGSESFNQRVGAWISAWVDHLKTRGIEPDRFGLLLVDEPRAHEHDDVIIPWARAIRAANPKVLIWEDPIYAKPSDGRSEMFELCHVLCPNRPMWLAHSKEFEAFYLGQRDRGRTLQLYSCSGPARLLDPYSYYRLQAWHCWKIGATGSFFWAFGDSSGTSSWNEYLATSGPYTPLFLDDRSVTAAKQMEAIRESAEDYEYFVMLRAATGRGEAAGRSSSALAKARSLATHAADEVLNATGVNNLNWHSPKDRSKADAVRVQLLESLTELTAGE
ncbi:MAG: hypothetical protein KA354_21050 [Phycisphaerae bacterium]|nr:hypothetical protein [Phycisphaerae bacterium]